LAGDGIGDCLAQFMGAGRSQGRKCIHAPRAASASRVRHHSVEDLVRDVIVITTK
jgi:hypothetical protein